MKFFTVLAIVSAFVLCSAQDEVPVETTSSANVVSQASNSKVPAKNKCPNGPYEGVSNDCNAYYICLKPSGRKIKLTCMKFFHFDMESKSCKYNGALKC